MAKPYGLLTEAEYDALLKNARHTRGGTLIDHFSHLIQILRKVFATR